MTFDREGLQRWYREAMRRRLAELRDLRAGLAAGDAAAQDAARSVAQSLRGSGATYGYPGLSEAASMVESAPDASIRRRVEGLIEDVRRLAVADEPQGGGLGAEWLGLAAGETVEEGSPTGFGSLEEAWDGVAARSGITREELVHRVAELFGLGSADLERPSKAALRLVPEVLIRSKRVLPLREDAESVTVATADPTSLEVEAELVQLTGRTPAFVVADPEGLRHAIAAVLDPVPDGAIGGTPATARRVVPSQDGEERILVVDDDAEWRLLARGVLEKGGYEVEEAGDGAEAMKVLDATRGVALIVADLNMPRMDGVELIWALRARDDWAEIPVIVVTGETDEVLEANLMEEGADDYIRKPLDVRLFLARVAATIRRAEH